MKHTIKLETLSAGPVNASGFLSEVEFQPSEIKDILVNVLPFMKESFQAIKEAMEESQEQSRTWRSKESQDQRDYEDKREQGRMEEAQRQRDHEEKLLKTRLDANSIG